MPPSAALPSLKTARTRGRLPGEAATPADTPERPQEIPGEIRRDSFRPSTPSEEAHRQRNQPAKKLAREEAQPNCTDRFASPIQNPSITDF